MVDLKKAGLVDEGLNGLSPLSESVQEFRVRTPELVFVFDVYSRSSSIQLHSTRSTCSVGLPRAPRYALVGAIMYVPFFPSV